MGDHVVYSKEAAFGTWVTPAKWLPVEEASLQSQRANLKLAVSGAHRGRYLTVLNDKPVNGSLVFPWWTTNVGTLINAFMRTIATTTPSSGVYDHALLFDDTVGLLGISAQQQRGTVGTNVLSAVAKAFKISAVTKNAARVTIDYEAKDEAKCGGTWDWDGSASPAIITPTAYPAIQRPLMFYDATLIMGGTPSLALGKLSVAGGTTHKLFRSCEISVDLGVDADGFGLAADPTRQEVWPGDRVIAVTMERSWSDVVTTFYDNWKAGTAMALDLTFVGPIISTTYHYEAHICIPSLVFDRAQIPNVTGSAALKKKTLAAEAQTDATTGVDFGLWIRTSEATL